MAVIKNKTVFIHIPKNAGISIGQAFSNNPKYDGNHNRPLNKYRSHEYHKFAICRNPYDRFVSSFEYQKKLALKGIGLGKFKQRQYIKTSNPTFDQYVDFVYRSKRINELHTRHQTYWLKYIDGSPIRDIRILRFENLQNDLDEYFNEINIPLIKLLHTNSTNRTNLLDYYSKQSTIHKVQELYKRDFIYFKYDLDINSLIYGK